MKRLRKNAQEYINLRRSLGYKLKDVEPILNKFCSFMEHNKHSFITATIVYDWAMDTNTILPSIWGRRYNMVRKFAQYMKAIDTRHEIPPYGLLPYKFHRGNPYIYNKNEVIMLLKACNSLTCGNGLRRYTYYTLFGLLTVTGMRISESVALTREDVDLTHGIITIRQTKFNKSRLIPLHKSTVNVLNEYCHKRDKIHSATPSPYFFLNENGTPLTDFTVRYVFIHLSRKIGFRQPTDSHGPRIHDLRHTFAVNTIIKWYRGGADVESQIPILSTYLGHTKPSSTYWYLSSIPEIIGLAGARLQKHLGGHL